MNEVVQHMNSSVDLLSLINACIHRSESSEKKFYLMMSPRVMAICRRYSNSKFEAEDYFQECFILLFKKLSNYDPTKGEFIFWMNKLCVNAILQCKRKSLKFNFREILDETLHDPDAVEINDIEEINYSALIEKLPDGYRTILNLYYFEQYSHTEISKLLSIAETTSRSQLSRAKLFLKKLIVEKNETR